MQFNLHVDVFIQISATKMLTVKTVFIEVILKCAAWHFSGQVLKVFICLVSMGRSSSCSLHRPGSMPGPTDVKIASKCVCTFKQHGVRAEKTNLSNNQRDHAPFKSMPHKTRKLLSTSVGKTVETGQGLGMPRRKHLNICKAALGSQVRAERKGL